MSVVHKLQLINYKKLTSFKLISQLINDTTIFLRPFPYTNVNVGRFGMESKLCNDRRKFVLTNIIKSG